MLTAVLVAAAVVLLAAALRLTAGAARATQMASGYEPPSMSLNPAAQAAADFAAIVAHLDDVADHGRALYDADLHLIPATDTEETR